MIVRDEKILMGKRKNAHGDGTWSFPGGHLEFGESLFDCAIRETDEETGIKIKNLNKGIFSEDFFEKEDKHYITFFIIAEFDEGEPELREPEKCERWEWFLWDNLPSPLFLPLKNLIESGYKPVL